MTVKREPEPDDDVRISKRESQPDDDVYTSMIERVDHYEQLVKTLSSQKSSFLVERAANNARRVTDLQAKANEKALSIGARISALR